MMKVKFTVLPEELISPVSEYCADIASAFRTRQPQRLPLRRATVFALRVRRTT